MEQQTGTGAAKSAGPWEPLDLEQRRVLGVLAEKAKTTPDAYPLSLNALVTGCNQKSNRDPLLNLTDDDAEEALGRCQKRLLAIRVQTSGRVVRYRHNLYDEWDLEKVDLAVMAELLLRGPQTEGELRSRASRMEPIEDLDTLRRVLRDLTARNLVVYLTPEERRGAVLTHGFHPPEELRDFRARVNGAGERAASPPPAPTAPTSGTPVPPGPARSDKEFEELKADLSQTRGEAAELRQRVLDLEGEVSALREEVQRLKEALGV